MAVNLRGRDFISINDFTPEEINQLLDTADWFKLQQKAGIVDQPLKGKTLAMIFQKASTRTRVSFEVGIWQLGGYALYLSSNDLQLKRGETIADSARVMSRYVDGIMIRTFSNDDVVDLAKYAEVPVINGLTDLLHPCQVMADLMTIREKKGTLPGLRIVYIGDGNNMTHSLMHGAAKCGMEMVVATPKGAEPDPVIVEEARSVAQVTGARIELFHDPKEAALGADVIYTDVWASMGQEAQADEKHRLLKPYQINAELMSLARPNALFMHCLPAHRGDEVTDEVIDGKWSVVWDQAENRLHAQKAIMACVM